MAVENPAALLRRLLMEPTENDWLEFKQNNADPDRIGKWVSACANAAILASVERAYMVWGVEDKTKKLVGTTMNLSAMKQGGENFTNWISRVISPKLMMEFLDFEMDGLNFSILVIEPTYDRPVRFKDEEYLRIGENVKELKEFPEHEKSLWLATSRHRFEGAIAMTHQTVDQVFAKLDVDAYYKLARETAPQKQEEIIRRFIMLKFLREDMEGKYDITNLGAILFAKNVEDFPSIASKSVRVIKYLGTDKRTSAGELEGKKGYAAGFAGLINYIMKQVPHEEVYSNGVRSTQAAYPQTAIREIIANALIHQDFTISGAGPVVEIYQDRVEVTNPGNTLIEVDRLIDERRSRNERLAAAMRSLGLCEERGGGLDKAIIEIEERNLPAPNFISSTNSMRVVLFGPKAFSDLSKEEKLRACFYHCILRWVKGDYMSNTTLRERFKVEQGEYQVISAIITESVKKKRIIPADPNQGNRYAKYVPYWVR